MMSPPGRRGYAMPAEWAPHRATWIAWPHNRDDWPGKFAPIAWAYAEMVRVLWRNERVCILVQTPALRRQAKAILKMNGVDLKKVDFFVIPRTASGPATRARSSSATRRVKKIATHWRFNGWAKYPNHKRDDRVAPRIAAAAGVPEYPVLLGGREIVMEGGAIDVDGKGTLMATEECLLSDVQARNPGLGRAGIEAAFADVLGIKRVIWLDRGIAGRHPRPHRRPRPIRGSAASSSARNRTARTRTTRR